MKYFLYKLLPPRSTFPTDMTSAERAIMQDHVAYWRGLMDKGFVVVFGPVADPSGPYGIAVVRTDDNADVHALGANDPAIRANAGFSFEVHPMLSAVLPEGR